MYTLERLKSDHKNARAGHDKLRANLLGVLVGACENKQRTFSPARELMTGEVMAEIKRLLDAVVMTQQMINERLMRQDATAEDILVRTSQLADASRERTILERYMPKAMTPAEIGTYAADKKAQGGDLGTIMRALKEDHPGRYDGKEAAEIIKTTLAGP